MTVRVYSALTLLLLGCGSRTGLSLETLADASTPPVREAAAPACGPASCAGCCDDAGDCQSGDAQALCGEQGRACVACELSLYEICHPQPNQPDERVCFAACDPRYCMGGCCLADGTCIHDTGDTMCGTLGRLCLDCTATGDVCKVMNGVGACVGP